MFKGGVMLLQEILQEKTSSAGVIISCRLFD